MEKEAKEYVFLPTTCVSDAQNGLKNMHTNIKPLLEKYKICGPAHTVSVQANDNLAVLKGIRTAKSGDILVVDAKGHDYNCQVGDFVVGMAKVLGVAGIVMDGHIRDIVGVKAVELPVFCTGTTVAAGGKAGVGEVGGTIACGGVAVNEGDMIVGDADGVVVVPADKAKDVFALAAEKESKDAERAARILQDADSVRRHLDQVLGL